MPSKDRIKHRYNFKIRLHEVGSDGQDKRVHTYAEAYSSINAAKRLLVWMKMQGLTEFKSIHFIGEAIPCSEYHLKKPPMHKHELYSRIYDGLTLIAYENKETKQRLTPEEYKALKEEEQL
mgnify:CR=1 FL=1